MSCNCDFQLIQSSSSQGTYVRLSGQFFSIKATELRKKIRKKVVIVIRAFFVKDQMHKEPRYANTVSYSFQLFAYFLN